MIKPNKLELGDTIGVLAPSNPIIDDNIEEIEKAKIIVEDSGFKVKFSRNLFSRAPVRFSGRAHATNPDGTIVIPSFTRSAACSFVMNLAHFINY